MPIKIGTDCSGMEAPIQAIRNLGVSYRHMFSCDIDKHARATIAANFPGGRMYEDLTQRDQSEAPSVDLYIAGFPCQPFSCAGLQQGFRDLRGRGKVFFYILDYLAQQQPRVFILENVSGLKTMKKGTYFDAILKALDSLGTYNVVHQVLDTKEHGVPQNRKRIYIVGIRKDRDQGTFSFPAPIACPSIELFLDKRRPELVEKSLPPPSQGTARTNVKMHLRRLKREGSDPHKEPFVLDCDSSTYRSKYNFDYSPCLTVGRRGGHWVTNRGRRLLKTEMMRLHGMDPTQFKVVVSETQLGRQLGNTMSVNVLERLLVRLLPAAGLVQGALRDRWESGEALRALRQTRGRTFLQGEVSRRAAAKEEAPQGKKRRFSGEPAAAKRVRRVQ